MLTDLVIVGTGGQGREVLDIVSAMIADGASLNVVGFVDDAPSPQNRDLVESQGHPILGDTDWLCVSAYNLCVVIGVGSALARRQIDRRLRAARRDSPVLVHPSASVGSATQLGRGSCVWAGARLTTNIRAGRHVHVNQNATVGHDCVLDDYVTLNPLAAVSGNVRLEEAAMVGAGAVVLQGRSVGPNAVVGAAACVTRDVGSAQVVVGVPAAALAGSTPQETTK